LFEAYPRYEHLLASAQLTVPMLGMGTVLGPRDFLGALLVVALPVALGRRRLVASELSP
jgi:hypothetical protein